MLKYNCLIVDDEPMATSVLESYVQKITQFNLIGCCTSALEAQTAISVNKIDVLFLDIQMPDLSGIDFIKTIPDKPLTVFTTAHSEHALDAFDLDITDFLLKPITFERFFKTSAKLLSKLEARKEEQDKNTIMPLEDRKYFFVKSDMKIIKLAYSDVLFVESMREYVGIHTKDKRIMILQSLAKLEEVLPSELFSRIHRSYIVNLEHVKSIYGNMVVLSNDKELPISKSQKDDFLSLINKDLLF